MAANAALPSSKAIVEWSLAVFPEVRRRQRPTLTRGLQDSEAHRRIGLPWGCCITPFAPIDQASTQPEEAVVRCEECGGYLSPACSVVNQQRHWRCSLCNNKNPLPYSTWRGVVTTQCVVEYSQPCQLDEPPLFLALVDTATGICSPSSCAPKLAPFLQVICSIWTTLRMPC